MNLIRKAIRKKIKLIKGKKTKEKAKDIAMGTTIGATLGVVTAILAAPKSGKETRDDIKYKGMEIKEKVEETSVMFQQKFEDTMDKMKETKAKKFRSKVVANMVEESMAEEKPVE